MQKNRVEGTVLVEGKCEGAVLSSQTALSFWGGVDPKTGEIIDRHHPLSGSTVAGTVLAIPSSRGSCSGSGVILELLLNGHSPAALVFEREESILTLGVIIAREFFGKSIPVVQLSSTGFKTLLHAPWVQISGGHIQCMRIPDVVEPMRVEEAESNVQMTDLEIPDGFDLTAFDSRLLSGELGKAAQVAARVVLRMAAIQKADKLIDVTQVHIDGCIYTGPATLRFAQSLCDWGAKVRIPATLNSISIDRRGWRAQGMDPALAEPAGQLADAYVMMGAQPTYTCAPYLLDSAPGIDEQVMWGESNAVVYANSVLGARTAKCPDYLDICVALTGRAPDTSCHIPSNRLAQIKVALPPVEEADDSLFPLLGYVVGEIAANSIPIVTGLEHLTVSGDDLKAFGAAFATTSSAPMFHISGLTPEASTAQNLTQQLRSAAKSYTPTLADLTARWHQLDGGTGTEIDLISLGNPHMSYTEIAKLATLCKDRTMSDAVTFIVTCGRQTSEQASKDGFIDVLETFGIQMVTDTCWCMIVEPVIPPKTRTIMTNSAKYAHYGAGLTGRQMRFGSLAQCLDAACTGQASHALPRWLIPSPDGQLKCEGLSA